MRRRLVSIGLAMVVGAIAGCRGHHQGPGEVTKEAVPAPVVAERARRQDDAKAHLFAAASGERPAEQILFGDLHVHTTFSPDAFMRSLPMLQGEGAHPPADACDFARFCSQLDFWSINDHAEGVTPRHWAETKEAIRQCNAVAGDPANPDLVAFLGWEWTQVGLTPQDHYGHKNVIFRDTAEDRVPKRPISALNSRWPGRCASGRRCGSAFSSRSSTSLTGSATSTSASTRRRSTPSPCARTASTRASCRSTATSPPTRRRSSTRSSRSGASTPSSSRTAPPGACTRRPALRSTSSSPPLRTIPRSRPCSRSTPDTATPSSIATGAP